MNRRRGELTPDLREALQDMLNESDKAMRFAAGLDYSAFVNDERTTYAVIRALEIIGEAAKKVPQAFRDKYSNIPWRVVTGMRDRLIHGYGQVDLEVVWKTVQDDVPMLKSEVERILAQTGR